RNALHTARETKARYAEVTALIGLAAALHGSGQPDEARSHAEQAADLAATGGLRMLEGQALTVLADAHRTLGNPDEARNHARQALAIQRETGHRLGEARALVVLGHVEGNACHWEAALDLLTGVGAGEAEQVR